ncbi:hypothetical protein N7519_008105 [Penicillium mononematosum]|uniref:uncharacterized protein n=1 Tax=Penicillium mononematosum TaxID=268346 RepID=UPI002546FB28|nr:uncharacterized protein N7519_008105 [Penicillium mononematosum]KAJ6186804.1 hypothetical protein N7519_008105 [Penicillium mononematosum]
MQKRTLASPVKLPLAQPGTREGACGAARYSSGSCGGADEEVGVLLVVEGFGMGRGEREPRVEFWYRKFKVETSACWEVRERGVVVFLIDV